MLLKYSPRGKLDLSITDPHLASIPIPTHKKTRHYPETKEAYYRVEIVMLTNNISMPDEANYDDTQMKAMNSDMCIQVDENDNPLGPITKKMAHLNENIQSDKSLHRAFSIFLFSPNLPNADGTSEPRLLLQQRAQEKITFGTYWTNTCCSHPLYYDFEMEGCTGGPNADSGKDRSSHQQEVIGAKRAALRKLNQELGIRVHIPTDSTAKAPKSDEQDSRITFTTDDVKYLTRILYKAPSDGMWGEHEVDYIFFMQIPKEALSVDPENAPIEETIKAMNMLLFGSEKSINPDLSSVNLNEVMNTRFVNRQELDQMIKENTAETDKSGLKLTPWFRMISESMLYPWWKQLGEKPMFDLPTDAEKVHKLN